MTSVFQGTIIKIRVKRWKEERVCVLKSNNENITREDKILRAVHSQICGEKHVCLRSIRDPSTHLHYKAVFLSRVFIAMRVNKRNELLPFEKKVLKNRNLEILALVYLD